MTLRHTALSLSAIVGLLLLGTFFSATQPAAQSSALPETAPAFAAVTLATGPQIGQRPAGPDAPAPEEPYVETNPAAGNEVDDVAVLEGDAATRSAAAKQPRLPDAARLVTLVRDGVTLRALNVPYVNQMYDVPGFERTGNCSCGPASLAMVLAYFGRLESRPVEIALPYRHLSQFGWALVDGSHRYGEVTFDRSIQGCEREASYGGLYGALMVDDQNRMTDWARFANAVTAHNLSVTHHEEGALNYEVLKAAVERGNPVVLTVRGLTGWGHLIVVTGYTEDGRLVVNDSYGSKWDGYPNYNGEGVLYAWEDFGQVRHGWEISGEGEGWQAEYRDPTGNVYVRTDRDINFAWGADVPTALLAPHYYAVRWSRVIDTDGSPQVFKVKTDGTVRIVLHGEVVAEAQGLGTVTEQVVELPLAAGRHVLEVTYDHAGGDQATAEVTIPLPAPVAQ